jgi:hypothetical protein
MKCPCLDVIKILVAARHLDELGRVTFAGRRARAVMQMSEITAIKLVRLLDREQEREMQ